MIFGNTTNTTCRFSFQQYNLFYTVHKHEMFPFMEIVTLVYLLLYCENKGGKVKLKQYISQVVLASFVTR